MTEALLMLSDSKATLIVASHPVVCMCGRSAILMLNFAGRTTCITCAPREVGRLPLAEVAILDERRREIGIEEYDADARDAAEGQGRR
jgi:hypothetical protein